MPNLYLLAICDDVGEVEGGVFDEAGEMLGTWCSNDATWHSEYVDPFLAKLGLPTLYAALKTKLVTHWRRVLRLPEEA